MGRQQRIIPFQQSLFSGVEVLENNVCGEGDDFSGEVQAGMQRIQCCFSRRAISVAKSGLAGNPLCSNSN
jgi:hypothetical protein